MTYVKSFFSTGLAVLLLSVSGFSQQAYDRSRLIDLFQNDDYEGAVTWLNSLSGLSGDQRFQSDLGYALYMKGDLERSKAALHAVLAQDPGNQRANLYLARGNEDLDRPDSALVYYLRLTRIVPANFRHWQKAIQLYNGMAMYDSALACSVSGYNHNPASGLLAVQYANALIRRKQTVRADSLVSDFLLRDSGNRDVIIKKIDIASNRSNHREVIHWGEKLLKDSADLTVPFINLAYSYLNVDSVDKSIYICEWLIGNNKAYPQVLYCAALGYARKKDFVQSNKYLDKCLELSILKEAITYYNGKSDNYEELKQYKLAASYHDTSYYIFQKPLDLYYAGRLYDKYLHNPSKAAAYYKRFIKERKTPASSEEIRIFEYIDGYLKGRTVNPDAKKSK